LNATVTFEKPREPYSALASTDTSERDCALWDGRTRDDDDDDGGRRPHDALAEGSSWRSVGARNDKFVLKRRKKANGIRKDQVMSRSSARRPRRSFPKLLRTVTL